MEQSTTLLSTAEILTMQVRGQSQRAYMGDAMVFKQWLEDNGVPLEAISYDVMVRYKAFLSDTYAKPTVARRFVVARRLLDVAVERGIIASNPAKNIKCKLSTDDSSPHTALSKGEAKRLLATVDTATPLGKRDKAILMLLIYGGIRRSECAAIKLGDITLKQEHHVLTIQAGKGDKRREVPLRPDMFRAIQEYLEVVERLNNSPDAYLFTGFRKGHKATAKGLTDRQIANIVQGYAEKANVKATPHDLRASAITYLIDTGAPIVVVQRLVGHSDPKTTERYYTRKQDLDNSPVYKIDLNTP